MFARTPAAIDRLLAAGASTEARTAGARPRWSAMTRLGQAGEPLRPSPGRRGIAASPSDYARLGNKEILSGS